MLCVFELTEETVQAKQALIFCECVASLTFDTELVLKMTFRLVTYVVFIEEKVGWSGCNTSTILKMIIVPAKRGGYWS